MVLITGEALMSAPTQLRVVPAAHRRRGIFGARQAFAAPETLCANLTEYV
jgi:hypothetical protein